MLENDGHWLKLMRTAPQANEANVCLLVSGTDIVCQIIQQIRKGVELAVTCWVTDQESAEFGCHSVDATANSDEQRQESSVTPLPRMVDMLESSDSEFAEEAVKDGMVSDIPRANHTEESSAYLEGKRKVDEIEEKDKSAMESIVPPSIGEQSQRRYRSSSCDAEVNGVKNATRITGFSISCDSSNDNELPSEYRPGPTQLENRQTRRVSHTTLPKDYPRSSDASAFCEDCNIQFMSPKTYRVHKQIYCKARRNASHEDHRQMFSRPASDMEPNLLCEDVFVVKRDSLKVIPPVIQPRAFFAAISTNPLILLPCSLVNNQDMIPHGGIISTGAPITLPAGITGSAVIENDMISLHPLKQPTKNISESREAASYPFSPSSSAAKYFGGVPLSTKYSFGDLDSLNRVKKTVPDDEKASKADGDADQPDVPLDLTVRKRKPSPFENTELSPRPKRKNSFPSTLMKTPPMQLQLRKSLSPEPCSSIHARVAISPPSFSNDASSSSGLGASSQPMNDVRRLGDAQECSSSDPSTLAPAFENAAQQNIISIGFVPSKLHKQGSNRCEDCNIEFYKYDNYLAHKKHYCAYRRRLVAAAAESLTSSSELINAEDNSSNHDQIFTKYDGTEEKQKSVPMVYGLDNLTASIPSHILKSHSPVFVCENCGVKFSTADNLNAHQTYYCSRKANNSQLTMNRARELSCRRCNESMSESQDDLDEWQCNYCDNICRNPKTTRSQPETRGFCCIICGYRGNTLRGMRTHMYDHLSMDSTQIEEILASSVVFDSSATVNGCSRTEGNGNDSDTCDSRLQEDIDRVPPHLMRKYRVVPNNKEHESCSENSASEDNCPSPKKRNKPSESPDSDRLKRDPPLEYETANIKDEKEDDEEEPDQLKRVNAICSVVIKKEKEFERPDSCEEVDKTPEHSSSLTRLRESPAAKDDDKTASCGETSVICRVSTLRKTSPEPTKKDDLVDVAATKKNCAPKKKYRQPPKSELKYCKSCDISFHHLSNYVAHKKFYCVSRTMGNFQQAASPVQ